MSYSVSISGHVASDTPEEAEQAEERIVTALRGVIVGLPGVTSATGNFQHLGTQDLRAEQ